MMADQLDKRVRVTKTERIFDGRGGYTTRETEVGYFWAGIHPLSISERNQYSQMNTDVTTKIYMRFDPRFQKGMRVHFRGKAYEVIGVLNPGYQDELMELVVNEV